MVTAVRGIFKTIEERRQNVIRTIATRIKDTVLPVMVVSIVTLTYLTDVWYGRNIGQWEEIEKCVSEIKPILQNVMWHWLDHTEYLRM